LNILHLKYAVEVAKTGSISQAAENLYMGQPNLSKAIRELETNIGMQLFKRSSKGATPTPKGAEFLKYAKNILIQINEMEALYSPDNEDRQRFSICVPRGSYISHAFAHFAASLDLNKEIDIGFKETNSMRAISIVNDGESNLAIIRYQLSHEPYYMNLMSEKQLDSELIWEFEYLALMSEAHPLADSPKISRDQLFRGIEIVHGDISIPFASPESQPRPSDKDTHRRIYVYERGSQFDLLSMVPSTYMWVSPLPLETLARHRLVQRKCCGGLRYRDVLVYPRGYQRTPLDSAFISTLFSVRDEVAALECV
jgi:DNA-binding transcriptional LysR family regulator